MPLEAAHIISLLEFRSTGTDVLESVAKFEGFGLKKMMFYDQ